MTDKAEESAVGPENQVKRPGRSMTPPPLKKRRTVEMSSMMPEEKGASQARGSPMSLEEDDPKVTAMSVLGEAPGNPPIIPNQVSAEMKHQLKMEIQKYGQHYDRVFKLLEGPMNMQENFGCGFNEGDK